ncbi:MAG: hypothetical protein K9N06_00820 [Candidatus Cloacimonetes bacterium]|nr:hypothetical protein [Candidatus Cloacimonadota bacterium]
MRYKNFVFIIVIITLIAGCDFKSSNTIRDKIDKGDYLTARRELTRRLEKEPDSGLNWLLLAETYRREYFPTYNAARFSTPLSSNWQYFPAGEFKELAEYEKVLSRVRQAGYGEQSAPEYYFLVCYNFKGWKYRQREEAKNKLQLNLNFLGEFDNDFSDNVIFWQKYLQAGRTIDFDWRDLSELWEKYPDSELIPLQILTQFLGIKSRTAELKINPYTLDRMRDFQRNYSEYAEIADSLYIYWELKPLLSYKHTTSQKIIFLDEVIAEMLSSTINHYCMWEKGKIWFSEGRTKEGYELFDKVIEQEMNKYNRNKLNKKLAEYAYEKGDFSQVLSHYRQIEDLTFIEQKRMWEAYLELGYESDANALHKKLVAAADKNQKERLEEIQYKYDLSRLQVGDLNLVQAQDKVTIAGKLSNKTTKTYEEVKIELTIINADGRKNESFYYTVNIIYPGTVADFKFFAGYLSITKKLKVTGKVVGFKKAE